VTTESRSSTTSSAAPRGDRGPFRPRGPRTGGRPRYVPRRKVCFFCANKNEVIDYKNPDKLRTFVSERAKIEPRRRSGSCARHQRELAIAIKRARQLALLPFVPDHVFPAPQPIAPVMSAPPVATPVATPAPAPAVTPPESLQSDR
jgi:small subunit ribosomal protein S18